MPWEGDRGRNLARRLHCSSGRFPFRGTWCSSDHPGSQPFLLLRAGDHSDPPYLCLTSDSARLAVRVQAGGQSSGSRSGLRLKVTSAQFTQGGSWWAWRSERCSGLRPGGIASLASNWLCAQGCGSQQLGAVAWLFSGGLPRWVGGWRGGTESIRLWQLFTSAGGFHSSVKMQTMPQKGLGQGAGLSFLTWEMG